jgi:L-seryl-tRNA(Ser) seleniumtransferase
MPLPPWTVELIRRGISDVARKASEPETLEKLKTQATEILQDLPETAARGLDAVMRKAEAGKESVQRWTRKQTAIAIPMVNASGVLMHADGTGVPLAQSAIDAGYELLRGDCVCDSGHESKLARKLASLLPGQDDYVVAVASSFPAALTAFSQLVQERPLVIHRSHAVRLPGGLPLPDAFGTLLPVIQEVGSIGDVVASDYDGFEKFCDIVADVGTSDLTLLDFGDRDAVQAVVLPVATLATSEGQDFPSAEAYLAKGADFVVMPGSGVCGGPDCGLLIGRRAAIETITSSPAWPALVASESTQAMLVVALELASSDAESIPVQALMATSVENLSSRAQRMATRLGGSDVVAECQVTTDDAKLTMNAKWAIPSRQLRLRHQTLSAEAWAEQLAGDVPAVIVGVENDQVVVDLRWVDTANDNQLAKSLGGQLAEEANA